MPVVSPLRLDVNWHILESMGLDAGVYAPLREAVQNSLEAGATQIEIHPEWVTVKGTKKSDRVDKLVVSDNGCGMSSKELSRFMEALGSSSKKISRSGNFGIGLKVASARANKHGIDVLTFRDYQASLIRICADDAGNYGLLSFDGLFETTLDEDGILRAPGLNGGALLDQYWREHGTVVIFQGLSPDESTYPFQGVSTVRSMLQYLQKRYFQVPKGVTIKLYDPASMDRETWAASNKMQKGQLRAVHGSQHYLDQYSMQKGTASVPSGRFLWWLFGDRRAVKTVDGKKVGKAADLKAERSYGSGGSVGVGHGFTGILFNGEVYEADHDHPAAAYTRFAQLGLHASNVRERVVILFEPTDGTLPNNVRSRMQGPEGGPAPWSQWASEWQEVGLPSCIMDLIHETEPADEEIQSEVHQRCLAMDDFLEHSHIVRKPRGRPPTKREDVPPRESKPPSERKKKTRGPALSRIRQPKIFFDEDPEPVAPAMYESETNVLSIYLNHHRYAIYRKTLVDQYGNGVGVADIIDRTIQVVVASELAQRVLWARSPEARRSYRNEQEYRLLTGPAAMDLILSGYLTLLGQMRRRVGSRMRVGVE